MQKYNIFWIFTLFLVLIIIFKTTALAVYKTPSYGKYTDTDYRVLKLKRFFSSYNSPLTSYSNYIITQADINNLDWKLIPAISGVESTFGKYIPFNSYNAYGWDNGTYTFTSWYHSISHVSQKLSLNYISKGAKSIDQIAPIYNPVTPQSWKNHVNFFINKLENTPPIVSEVLNITPDI